MTYEFQANCLWFKVLPEIMTEKIMTKQKEEGIEGNGE